MASFELLLRNDLNNYDYRIDLANETFRLQFIWNGREERYHFYIYSEDDVLLCETPIVLNNDLIGRFRSRVPTLPQGSIYTARESGELTEPLREDYGNNLKMYFTTEII
jgi:hypothetical protein